MIGGGLSVKEIATKLILSTKTVEAHREHIKAKLGFRSSGEAVFDLPFATHQATPNAVVVPKGGFAPAPQVAA